MPTTARASQPRVIPPALVVVAAWALPGLGYLLIGQRARGLTVGITIIALFVAGLLIGGIRVLEVPGYGPHGMSVFSYVGRDRNDQPYYVFSDTGRDNGFMSPEGPAMRTHPTEEIRAKPWSIAQIMTGPIGILAGAGAVVASRRAEDQYPAGARSHSRVNEIGVLYTAIAGMLNLLAIIDSHSRASQAGRPAPREES